MLYSNNNYYDSINELYDNYEINNNYEYMSDDYLNNYLLMQLF